MVDRLTPERRSWLMSRVRSADTRPEMAVRSALHAIGYRYRLHVKTLPGRPDMVFPARRKVILIHGCFWHGHNCRMGNAVSKTNVAFWEEKLRRNVQRDRRNASALRRLGWSVAIVWECQIKHGDQWLRRIVRFLDPPPK